MDCVEGKVELLFSNFFVFNCDGVINVIVYDVFVVEVGDVEVIVVNCFEG